MLSDGLGWKHSLAWRACMKTGAKVLIVGCLGRMQDMHSIHTAMAGISRHYDSQQELVSAKQQHHHTVTSRIEENLRMT